MLASRLPKVRAREDQVAALVETLSLTEISTGTSEDIFTGPSQWMPHGRIFGGQVLAQAIVAASRTLGPERLIHSLHGYFLRPGDVEKPITLGVDRIHDGRSFSTRRVQAYQDGLPILSLIASFQTDDPGFVYSSPGVENVPNPESLPTAAEVVGENDDPRSLYWSRYRAFDIRHVVPSVYLTADPERRPRQAVWVRSKGPLPDDPVLHRAALAFVMDYTILEPIVRVAGVAWATEGLKSASLDHAMWWHHPVRVDEWLLFVEDAVNTAGGRGLGFARVYNQEGLHVASSAQEGMLRIPTLR